jgi:signal transduction histidine kinase
MRAFDQVLQTPERQPQTRIARLASILTLVMVLVGLAMVAASLYANGGTINLKFHIYFRPFIATAFTITGLLILKHHPKHTVGWLILTVGFFAGLHFLVNAFRAFDQDVLLGNPDTAYNIATLLNHIVWWPIETLPYTLILLYFPDGKLLSPRYRISAGATVLGIILGIITGFHPGPIPEWGITDLNPAGIQGSEHILEALAPIYLVLFLIGGIGSLMSVTVRFRRSSSIERLQMKWLAYTALVSVSFMSVVVIAGFLFPQNLALVQLNYFFAPLLTFMVPITCGIAILRYRLWDINIIINRTVVYGSLTTVVIAIYIGIVGGLGTLLQIQTNTLIGLAAAGIIAVVFQPLRDHLQRRVDRLLYGERDDPVKVLSRLVHHPETADAPTEILPRLVQTIAHTLKIPHVAVWLPVGMNQMEPVASWGKPPDHGEVIPLTYQKETIGHLVVAPRGPQEQFNRFEQDLLATIAALTATTVRAVQLSDELRRSRQRIVTAREDERRRLRRDLHDGLGPQLASQMLGLEAVAQLMPVNPEKAQALLSSLKIQAEEAIQDVRRLVYDLRPPALDDLGLVEALKQSASRYENADLRFKFEIPDALPELPAAVETAVYRIAQEAMTNAVHHAEATLCVVRLVCQGAHILLEVRDNGRGLPQDHHSGVGLQAMQERTTELSGQCVLESLPGGGTLVRARLPLEVYDA